MKTFQALLMYPCLVGAFALTAWYIALVWRRQIALFATQLFDKWSRLGNFGRVLLVTFVSAMIVYGSTKTNAIGGVDGGGVTNAPMMMGNVPAPGLDIHQRSCREAVARVVHARYGVVQPEAGRVSAGATLAQNLWRRGCWEDWLSVSFKDGWVFPRGTNHLSRVAVMTQGELRSTVRDTDAVASLGAKVAHVPFDTCFYHELTPSNSYRFTWDRAYVDRNTNMPMFATIELFRNGDKCVSTNGVSTFTPREIPYPHVGIGQNDDWVRTNFVNAADVLSVGYANWVNDQVGVDLENGLYKFTATFPNDPPEATQLTVGDLSVVVTNAGEYIFLMEKGVEYTFCTTPYDASVEYSMQDDVGPDAEIVYPSFSIFNSPFSILSWWGGDGNGAWSIDGGWYGLYPPTLFGFGSSYWMPTFQGSPDVTDVSSSDFPMTFTAMLTDCCRTNGVTYRWSTEDDKILIASPYSQSTDVSLDPTFDEATFSLSVEAFTPERDYYSTLHYAFPTNGHRGLSFSLQAPKVVFLNDDRRTSRWYSVTMTIASPVPTNAVVSVMHSGNTGISYASDACGEEPLTMADMALGVAEGQGEASRQFFFACENLGAGTFEATCTFPDGNVMTTNRHYKVIEPLQKLVCMDETPAGGYYNPSELVAGTNAWLKVGVNGSFSPQEVAWRVVSGSARIVSSNGWSVCVEPFADVGEAVVEAAFGSDAALQPRFVLPISQRRSMSVCACVILDELGIPLVTRQEIEDKIKIANKIYSQVGVEFHLVEPIIYLDNPSFLTISKGIALTNGLGQVTTSGRSPQVTNLIAQVISPADVKLFWVERIVNGTPLAFTVVNSRSCILASRGEMTDSVVAHELGHVLGLQDVYSELRRNTTVSLPQGQTAVYKGVFSDAVRDWGMEEGRGFYATHDTHVSIIRRLLMHGRDRGGKDIPYAPVEGYSVLSRNIFDLSYVPVGAVNIRSNQ